MKLALLGQFLAEFKRIAQDILHFPLFSYKLSVWLKFDFQTQNSYFYFSNWDCFFFSLPHFDCGRRWIFFEFDFRTQVSFSPQLVGCGRRWVFKWFRFSDPKVSQFQSATCGLWPTMRIFWVRFSDPNFLLQSASFGLWPTMSIFWVRFSDPIFFQSGRRRQWTSFGPEDLNLLPLIINWIIDHKYGQKCIFNVVSNWLMVFKPV